MKLGTFMMRSDGLALLQRDGAPDVITETTAGELPELLLETFGPGASLVARPAGSRGPLRADVVRIDRRRAAA